MQNSEAALCNKSSAVLTHTAYGFGNPHRVAAEKLIVFGCTQMARQAQLHNKIVENFLCRGLVKCTFFDISFNIYIKKGRNSAKRHSGAVLLLNSGKVSKIGPLNRLFGICGGFAYIVTVHSRHFFYKTEILYLSVKLFGKPYLFSIKKLLFKRFFIIFLFFNQFINTVKRYSAVVTDNSSAAVSIGQTGNNVTLTGKAHFVGVGSENAVVMGCPVAEFGLYLLVNFITVSLTRLSCHTHSAKGVDTSF